MSDDIRKRLTKLIQDVKPDTEFNDDLNLREDLGIDSLETIAFLFEVEKEFDIELSEKDIDEYDLFNFGKLCGYIKKNI